MPSPSSMTRRTIVVLLGATLLALGPAGEAGAVTVAVNAQNFSFTPRTARDPRGGTVKWTFHGSTHTATDSSGMALFNSGPKGPGSTYSFAFTAAGMYPYLCQFHASFYGMRGSVAVPVSVAPTSGPLGRTFMVTWASAAPRPGFVFDVQVKRPGSSAFVALRTGTTARSTTFRPTSRGAWSFRSRLRKTANGRASGYSAAATVNVQ